MDVVGRRHLIGACGCLFMPTSCQHHVSTCKSLPETTCHMHVCLPCDQGAPAWIQPRQLQRCAQPGHLFFASSILVDHRIQQCRPSLCWQPLFKTSLAGWKLLIMNPPLIPVAPVLIKLCALCHAVSACLAAVSCAGITSHCPRRLACLQQKRN